MKTNAYIAGVGMTRFGKHMDTTLKGLAGEAISGGVGSFVQVLEPGQDVNSFFVYEHKLDAGGNPIYEDTNGD